MGATFVIALIYMISIIISLIDILVDAVDATVDVATVGTVGLVTSIADIVVEFILEPIQVGLFLVVIYLAPGELIANNAFYIGLFVFLSFLDIISSFIGFLPYYDFIETALEFVSETVQNSLMATFLF